MKKLVTVQDISCFGQCSITVALPVISAMGMETAILPSAILSTHTCGFKDYTFLDLTAEMPKIIQHWMDENVMFDTVYTGYIGNAKQLDYIKQIVKQLKTKEGLFIVDPVMADHGVFYPNFDKNFAKQMADLCNGADYIIPNLTEAAFLLGEEFRQSYDESYIIDLMQKLTKLGVKNIVLTGVSFDQDKLGVAYFEQSTQKIGYYFRERIVQNFHGTGDVFGSSLSGALALGLGIEKACKIAVDFTVDSMNYTMPVKDKHWYGVAFEKAIPNLVKALNN